MIEMGLRSQLIGALAAMVAVPGMAAANEFLRFGEVEGWKVFIDTTKNTCLIEKIDDAENVVQMGLTADRGVGYVGVFTKGETKIKKDETEAVAILMGENL
jgi:hypothetical protein